MGDGLIAIDASGIRAIRTSVSSFLSRISPERVAGVGPSPIEMPRAEADQPFGLARAASLSTVFVVNALAHHADAAEEAYRAALEADRGRDAFTLLRLHLTAAEQRAGRGDLPGAKAALDAAEAVAASLDAALVPTAYLLIGRATVQELRGDIATAYTLYREAARAAEAAGGTYAATKAAILAARISPDPSVDEPALRVAVDTLAREGFRDLFSARPAVEEWLRERLPEALRPTAGLLATRRVADARTTAVAATRPADLRLRLFGAFGIELEDRPVAEKVWRTAKAKELLALLATSQGHAMQRDAIIERLWPESSAATAVSKFHFTLHALRKELAAAGVADRIVVEKGTNGYALTLVGDVRIDHDEFIASLARARRARFAGELPISLDELRRAVSSYRGQFLADLRGQWIEELRERAEAAAFGAMRELARAELETGDATAAATLCRHIVESDPYDEEAHRLLMAALHKAGESEQALRHYAKLQRQLRSELDEEPAAPTQNLYRLIRQSGVAVTVAVAAD